MLRLLTVVLTLGWILGAVPAVQAQWLGPFFATFPRDFKRNNKWPEPFVYPDRAAVAGPIGVQIANGWRKQTMLTAGHFQDESRQLSHAGEMKVYWILTQVPPQRRIIFVQRSISPEVTAARVDAVQEAALRMRPLLGLPQVVETDVDADGWPAEDVERIYTSFEKNQPDVKLPPPQDASATGTGGT